MLPTVESSHLISRACFYNEDFSGRKWNFNGILADDPFQIPKIF